MLSSVQTALKTFSKYEISSQAIRFTELNKYYDYYTFNIVRPLFVVLLASKENIEVFRAFSRTKNRAIFVKLPEEVLSI